MTSPGRCSGFRKMLCWLSVISRTTTLSTTGTSIIADAARDRRATPEDNNVPPSAAERCKKILRFNPAMFLPPSVLAAAVAERPRQLIDIGQIPTVLRLRSLL